MLTQVVEVAGMLRKKVRVVGGSHSPSDIACTKDYMISLKKYKDVLEVNNNYLFLM